MSIAREHLETLEKRELYVAKRLLDMEINAPATETTGRIVFSGYLKQELRALQWAQKQLRVLRQSGLNPLQINEVIYAVGTPTSNGHGHTTLTGGDPCMCLKHGESFTVFKFCPHCGREQ